MRGKKRGKAAKKARASAVITDEDQKGPHSFIFSRGRVGRSVRQLVLDLRKVFEPYTGSNLKIRKNNTLRDIVEAANVLHVTHLISLTKTEISPYMQVMCTPRGPTLTFKILKYCLGRDVVSSLRRPNIEQSAFQTPPLLIMNNLSGTSMDMKLMSTLFQNMLPSIDVNKVKLKNMRRALLLSFDNTTKTLELRHYLIRVAPAGIGKTTKKLLRAKLPNLGKFSRMEEFVEKGGNLSESEGEMDGPHSEVILPQEVRGRGNIKASESAVRLKEVGPRITLKLVKIVEGLADGAVLHHEYVSKTAEEQQDLKAKMEKKRQLREKRKKEQLENIKKKAAKKEQDKQKSLEGMKKKAEIQSSKETADMSSDDDAAYFKEEVGENPDEDMFSRKRKDSTKGESQQPAKRKNSFRKESQQPGKRKNSSRDANQKPLKRKNSFRDANQKPLKRKNSFMGESQTPAKRKKK